MTRETKAGSSGFLAESLSVARMLNGTREMADQSIAQCDS